MSNLESLLGDKPADVDDVASDGHQSSRPPSSPTALKLDRWSLRRGRDWASINDTVGFGLPQLKREYFAADMLSTAWDPDPQLADNTDEPLLKNFIQTLMQTPEYESLHRKTRLDPVASEMAACAFAKQYLQYKEQQEEQELDEDGYPVGASEDEKLDQDSHVVSSVKEAMDEAKSDVDDLNAMRDSLGGDGAELSTMSDQRVKELFCDIRENHTLRKIMEIAGRYMRLAQSLQRSKPCHGADETVGIEYSDDISRILSSEYASLDDEDLELDFLRRFSEQSLMSREVKSTEDDSRGPIVVVVDESGSMNGDRVAHAKAMALAMLWVAEHQKRWCCLVGFAGATQGNFLVIEPGKRDVNQLIEWLKHFFGGGTSCDVPLELLPQKWDELGCPEGRTDIIQITDCALNVPDDVTDSFLAWKQERQVKLNTIVIGDEPGDMEKVTDRWWSIYDLSLQSDGVSECLSV